MYLSCRFHAVHGCFCAQDNQAIFQRVLSVRGCPEGLISESIGLQLAMLVGDSVVAQRYISNILHVPGKKSRCMLKGDCELQRF